MKTIRSIVAGNPHRLPARLKLISTRLGSLILLFQRMPVVQFLFPEASFMGSATVANSVSLAVTTVVGLGVFDSVAGATTIDEVQPIAKVGPDAPSTTAADAINVPATVSAPLNFEFTCLYAQSRPKSYSTTTLPAGLSLSWTNTATGVYNDFITGTPTTPGKYPVNITVWRYANNTGESEVQLFNIWVLGFQNQPSAAPATINSGGTSNLTCTATGNPVGTTWHPGNGTLTYQWYRGSPPDTSTPVGTTNATTPGFTTPALNTTTNYWVRIKSVLGASSTVTADSNPVTVTVSAPAATVSVAVAPASVSEDGAGNLAYTFTRTGATTAALTANFSVGGTATFSSDYTQSGAASFTASTGTVTIPIGSTTATVTVDPTADSTVEPNETAILTVTNGSGYTADATQATGTITNDDTPYSSWASVLSVSQNGPTQMPQGDGVTNLEKFAFNMESRSPDVRHLTVGALPASELAGLPAGAKAGVGGVLRLEFLRRKSSTSPGITYTPQFSSNIGTWDDFDGLPVSVSEVGPGTDWERVVVDDPTGGAARFGRVKVIKAP